MLKDISPIALDGKCDESWENFIQKIQISRSQLQMSG